MAEVKLSKTELRDEQKKLSRLERYLPTLKLKKAMLQIEVQIAKEEINHLEASLKIALQAAYKQSSLLLDPTGIDFKGAAIVHKVEKRYENIAGVDVPYLDSVQFKDVSYSLFDTPPWLEGMIKVVRRAARVQIETNVAREKKRALENELREVSIRVNLFEKILIPRTKRNIKRIKVFLDDQQLAAVSQAKVAKRKIEESKCA